ncbi:MAG: FecR domain-containing protein [Elusimicrobia bacterium]|nr:FecR domain-containing protein [Elusimicrobiota bacterium]
MAVKYAMRNILFLLFFAANAVSLQAQDNAKKPLKLLEIEVKKGDTLHAFAERYLDDPSRWPELLEYNKIPSGDPNLIIPGENLKVPVEMVKDEIADIIYLKNNVRLRRKEANEWKEAALYERMYPEDGIRTAENSFTQIKYLVGGMANINENSLVFLRPDKKRDDVVMLETGELKAKDIKVLTASAAIEPEKGSEYSAKVDRDKTTTLSVFKGKVDFISSGEVVTVTEGFMSTAKFNMPPMEPFEMPEAPEFKKQKDLEKEAETGKITISGNKVISRGFIDSQSLFKTLNIEEENEENEDVYIDKIHIQVAKDKEFTRISIDKVVDKANPEAWKETLVDGIYWWHAAFIDNRGIQGRYSNPVELVVDSSPPKITIEYPKEGEKVKKSIISVRGKTEIDMSVTVDDNSAFVDEDGNFIVAIGIDPGENRIEIEATNYYNRKSVKYITVYGDFKGSGARKQGRYGAGDFKINSPKEGEKIDKRIVVINGNTVPGMNISVNGDRAAVEEDGRFVAAVRLAPGENEIRIKSIDGSGKELEKILKVYGDFKGREQAADSNTKPVLSIKEPRDGEKIKKKIVLIKGHTAYGTNVTVNGVRSIVEEDGSFVAATALQIGENNINIKASNAQGEETVVIKVTGDFKE